MFLLPFSRHSYTDKWFNDICTLPKFMTQAAIVDNQLVGLIVAETKHYSRIALEVSKALDMNMSEYLTVLLFTYTSFLFPSSSLLPLLRPVTVGFMFLPVWSARPDFSGLDC